MNNDYSVDTKSSIPSSFWCKSKIDYSAANEYYRAHYQPMINYFQRSKSDVTDNNSGYVHEENIYNARYGCWDEATQTFAKPSLSKCGFTLCQTPDIPISIDFNDFEDIKSKYIPHLKTLIHDQLFDSSKIKHLYFWHPMLRSEAYDTSNENENNPKIKRSSIAQLVHIDSDVNAFSLDELLSIVENNLIQDKCSFDKQSIMQDVQLNNHRFLLLNTWRNIDKIHPIQSAPLGLFVPNYTNKGGCFPLDKPKTSSNWYTYPEMTYQECLCFLQYDRKASVPSDIWHCALRNVRNDVMRKSFDLKVLIVLNETSDDDVDDRWRNKVSSILNLEESGCFCDSQAEQRNLQ